ncbi:MAG: hypothetical protein Q8K58_12080 [Acidimicrobiales bacterium]|nr:hypothetical protein [Acidimicrobiales bacterium]
MDPASRLDALFALLPTGPGEGVDGATLTRTLNQGGRRARPDRLLTDLLALERTGHVTIERPAYSFALTHRGRAAAYELGPGVPAEATVVMVDLVGFVAYTEAQGDEAAVRAARALGAAAEAELGGHGGRVVKQLGDGILGLLPVGADPAGVVRAIADRTVHDDGTRWPVRAAARAGRPIALAGDVYGADVNVVARLCTLAASGELLLGADGESGAGVEQMSVRGVARAVAVRRVAL